MTESVSSSEPPLALPASLEPPVALEMALDRIAPGAAVPSKSAQTLDNALAIVRLGIAAGLYAALRCRYAGKAAHSLRVALTCSAWSARLGLTAGERDPIEVAALLHDVGVLGVPDPVLLKPGPLNPDEAATMEQARPMGLAILRSSCSEPAILAVVENAAAWFDGSRGGSRLVGRQIPLGARMLAISEAYDAMTTDQVFRRAMPAERAMAELFAAAGTQFDPDLTADFLELAAGDMEQQRREAARLWLRTLSAEGNNSLWHWNPVAGSVGQGEEAAFGAHLLEHMHDAVAFIDAHLRILQWNHGAERMTGISGAGACSRIWSPLLLGLRNEKGDAIADEDCPVTSALRSGVQSLRRLTICGRGERSVPVDTHTIPVPDGAGRIRGAVVLLHDASSEITLEQQCQRLYDKATKDPLTQVANRAEFDRVHEMFVQAHQDQHVSCSLIMCDLDHFKRVNDTFGHQAGDEAIKALARLLKNSCRSGDLVARYGGEEFVMLCANCDNSAAARRAEQIRAALAQQSHPMLQGRAITASFGVTEIQPGDTPETMLRRSDRALFVAKEAGRNRVVQLGVGNDEKHDDHAAPLSGETGLVALHQVLVTPVPLTVAVEKLRGFIADQQAKVLQVDGGRVQLRIDNDCRRRRSSDRPVAFQVEILLGEEQAARPDNGRATGRANMQTRIRVAVRPTRSRDRRRGDVLQRSRDLLASLRSYLMATQEEERAEEAPQSSLLARVTRRLFGR